MHEKLASAEAVARRRALLESELNEENLIRRAGVYALSGWLNDQRRMTDKISCTESH